MLRTLTCFVPGSKDVFLVDIDETKSVSHLKKEIMKANPLATVNEAALTLYKINIDISGISDEKYKQIIAELSRHDDYVFTTKEFLRPSKKLNTVFGSSDPSKDRIHILAVPPPGKPINSGALSLTLPD